MVWAPTHATALKRVAFRFTSTATSPKRLVAKTNDDGAAGSLIKGDNVVGSLEQVTAAVNPNVTEITRPARKIKVYAAKVHLDFGTTAGRQFKFQDGNDDATDLVDIEGFLEPTAGAVSKETINPPAYVFATRPGKYLFIAFDATLAALDGVAGRISYWADDAV